MIEKGNRFFKFLMNDNAHKYIVKGKLKKPTIPLFK